MFQIILVLLLLVPRGATAAPLRPQIRRLPEGVACHPAHSAAHVLLVCILRFAVQKCSSLYCNLLRMRYATLEL